MIFPYRFPRVIFPAIFKQPRRSHPSPAGLSSSFAAGLRRRDLEGREHGAGGAYSEKILLNGKVDGDIRSMGAMVLPGCMGGSAGVTQDKACFT